MLRVFLFSVLSMCYLYPLYSIPAPLELDYIEKQVMIDLVNPVYEDGVLCTSEGGVLTACHLRVQARNIVYTKRLNQCPPEFCLYCEGDLLIDYRGHTLTGNYLFFNFLTNTGMLIDGKAGIHPWYVGGRVILLNEDGEIVVNNGYITTSEGEIKEVSAITSRISITQNKVLNVQNPLFFIKRTPILWLPGFKYDLNNIGSIPVTAKVGWGGFLDLYLSLRYHCLTWRDLLGYLRLDGYLKRGVGVGLETEYAPCCKPVEFYTKSYYVNDLSIADPIKRHRYRFEGVYYAELFDCTGLNFTYDFVSDGEMAADYINEDFDLETAGRTELDITRQTDGWIADLLTRVRVNSFQSINQELPSLTFSWHPTEIAYGIMVENFIKASYLSYVFSDEDKGENDFQSGRFAVNPRIYRSFNWGPFIFTPEASFVGIAYTQGPHTSSALGQSVGEFALRLESPFWKCTPSCTHTINPYIHFKYLTSPRVPVDNYFLFSIDDAYAPLKIARFGVKNSVILPCCMRPLFIDIWANAFFDSTVTHPLIPKGYLNIEWTPYSRIYLSLDSGFNFEHRRLDFINALAEWTINENVAYIFEYRHRSKFAWRKGDFYDFLLDATRSEEALLASPLSDQRDIYTLKMFYRLSPETTFKFFYRYCWNRPKEGNFGSFHVEDDDFLDFTQRPFSEYEVELSTLVFDHWRLGFVFSWRYNDPRYSFSLKLVP